MYSKDLLQILFFNLLFSLAHSQNKPNTIGRINSPSVNHGSGKVTSDRVFDTFKKSGNTPVNALIQNSVGNAGAINSFNAICTGSLGDPVVNITFGAGSNPAQPLSSIVPGASTTLTYVSVAGNPASPTPVDGQYTISNNTPFNFAWHSGAADHTPGDVNGYLAFYNSQETPGLEFYRQTVSNLCGSVTYEFAAWIANCLDRASMDGVDPDITFRIERPDGTLISSYNTGGIPETFIFTWQQFGFFFTMPANETTVVLKMINNNVGGTALPGNDLAIDDITFRPCGPTSSISFSNSSQVDTLEICPGSTANLYGSVSPGYNNPNYRWQTSVNNGANWQDIPSASALQLQITPSASAGKYIQYRLVFAEGNNINSPNCRIASNTINLLVHDIPQGGLIGDSICVGAVGQLTLNPASGQSPFSISYSDPSGNTFNQSGVIPGTGFSTPSAISVNTNFTLLSLRDANGCERLNGFNQPVATISIRTAAFNAPPDKSTCETSPVQLSGNNGPGYLYQWSPSTFLNDPTLPNPIASPDATIQYSVIITEPVCSTDSVFNLTVTVNPNPVVAAQKLNDIDCTTPTARLMATGATDYLWAPATGLDNANKPDPIASITSTTTFIVTGTDPSGCSAKDTVTIQVTNGGKPIFVLPNAFTPNGDGRNDCFGIQRWGGVTIKEFSIFNRWGQRVFSTKDPSRCWDGRYNGKIQDSGGFAYVIMASSMCGEIKQTGVIMLIQ